MKETFEPAYKWRYGDDTVCANLRHKWPEQLKRFNDLELAAEYYDFSMSELAGNNDERFLEWIVATDG